MARRDEGANGITQRPRALKDVWIDADGNWRDREGNLITPVSGGGNLAISADTTLTAADHNAKDLFLASTHLLTINTGLGATFGCNIFGAFTYGGSATVTDKRVSGATNPSCSLVHTPTTDTYELHGSKA